MAYTVLDRVYSIFIDVMTGVSSGNGNATFYNTDSHTSYIEVTVTNGVQSFDMTEYNYVLVIDKPNKQTYRNEYTTTDKSKLVIEMDSQMLAGVGNNKGQLYIMKTTDNVAKVLTMVEFNYIVKEGNYNELAPESTTHDALYISLRNDVDSILSKIENGEIGGSGMTATQKEQLATAYNHAMSDAVTTTEVVNSAVATYVEANKATLKGDKGDTGAKGDKGDKGDPFTYADFTSEQLAALKGAKGDKGDKGDTGADGVAGAKGDKGDRGEKGADGVTPTLSIGTVTTGAAGSSASVTMGGTASSYVLNFTIPKGDKGDKGDTGASGSGGSSSSGSSNGGIVFEDTFVTDANLWLTNGYIKTSDTDTQNLPPICASKDAKWGILFFIGGTSGTGTQMFFPLDGEYKGKIFTRTIVRSNGSTSAVYGTWYMLASENKVIEEVTGTIGTITLSDSLYQRIAATGNITINLPIMDNNTRFYKEIHLFYWSDKAYTVTVVSPGKANKLFWESVPTLVANTGITEFTFIGKGDSWVCRGITYKLQS